MSQDPGPKAGRRSSRDSNFGLKVDVDVDACTGAGSQNIGCVFSQTR